MKTTSDAASAAHRFAGAVLLMAASAVGCGKGDTASSSPHPDGGAPDARREGMPDTGLVDQRSPDATRDSSGADHVSPDAGATWNPKPCSFYVAATGGSPTNPGTSALPFDTLTTLQTALRASSSKVGCLKAGSGGSYDLAKTLVLEAGMDDGETWESDPAGGVDSAVVDGGGTLSCLIETDANDITIDGLTLRHTLDNLTCHDDGKTSLSNLTITNNDIGFNAAGKGSGGFPPCLMANGAKGVTVAHNYVHDCASEGIGLFAYQTGLVLDDVVVDGNFVVRAVQEVMDGGAIYIMVHNGYVPSNIKVTNNFVRDYGTSTVENAHGIYLDESTNHVVVSGNVIGAPTVGSGGSTGCLIADGYDNQFIGNICDLGTTGVAWSGVWWYPKRAPFTPANNVYSGNIVVSRFSGDQETNAYQVMGPSFVQINSPSTDPSISDNMYHNYGGGQVRTDGNHVGDTSPRLEDPLCSGNLYALAASSPALSAPMNFQPIVGGWGPPGFVIPSDANRSCP
jgi:hypothetical protein